VPTTIRDVAAAAGVSPATVSRVLNGKEDVAADLRRRVLDAVTGLGYRRNGPARSLRTRAAMVLGVIISDITNPFFTAVVRGAEDQAQLAGYSVVLANADEDVAKGPATSRWRRPSRWRAYCCRRPRPGRPASTCWPSGASRW
jgi:LacI family transcriptional regulator